MIYNRPLTVYTTNTRRANVYQSAPQDIGQFFERLHSSQAIPFDHDAYKALPKSQQDDLKDVGGFVLGELRGGRRKAGAVLSRCAAVLDADNLGPGETDGVVRRMEALGCCYCIYSTAKHSPDAPRLRIVIPFSEDITADEYEPVTRLLCQMIQPEMTWFDPSTAEPSRMMYYPAHCQDIAPVYYAGDKPLLDARVLLSRLQDWQDVTSWPRFPQEQTPARLAAKQGDPETKHGVVGAFCRVYDVPAAMDKFLPGVYEETDTPAAAPWRPARPAPPASPPPAAPPPAARCSTTGGSSCTPTMPPTPAAGSWSTPSTWCGCTASETRTMRRPTEHGGMDCRAMGPCVNWPWRMKLCQLCSTRRNRRKSRRRFHPWEARP